LATGCPDFDANRTSLARMESALTIVSASALQSFSDTDESTVLAMVASSPI
jgi:hypothetical protein